MANLEYVLRVNFLVVRKHKTLEEAKEDYRDLCMVVDPTLANVNLMVKKYNEVLEPVPFRG